MQTWGRSPSASQVERAHQKQNPPAPQSRTSASRSVRDQCLLGKPPGLQYFLQPTDQTKASVIDGHCTSSHTSRPPTPFPAGWATRESSLEEESLKWEVGEGKAGGRRSPGKQRVKRQRKLLEIYSGEMPCSFLWLKFHVTPRRCIFPS